MQERSRRALERQAEQARERSRENWNRLVRADEAELREAIDDAERRRAGFHIVTDEEG